MAPSCLGENRLGGTIGDQRGKIAKSSQRKHTTAALQIRVGVCLGGRKAEELVCHLVKA